ncbi:replication protein C, IncQ-type [Aeromonas caviae]|uniref:replication protein C, IncQ-type n=1 Tax=Aeromonas caviae TaxID=648 RepID=UPI002B45F0ED|nr:replication protein C, IncQ-type [Aeromonas caviae]
MSCFELTHARHDHMHCLAPGLFRAISHGQRRRDKLEVIYRLDNGNQIEFSGPEPLGADDLRVLQGLVALAGLESESGKIGPIASGETGEILRDLLQLRGIANQQDVLVVKSSLRKLAKEIGYANPRDTNTVRRTVERLWKVSVIAQVAGLRSGFRLLANYASDPLTDGLFVALNPLLTNAILGNGRYTYIDLAEVRQLRSSTARILHQRLCAWIDCGRSKPVGLDKLVSYAFPDKSSAATNRKRQSRVRKALYELAELGWSISEHAKGRFTIGRPALSR